MRLKVIEGRCQGHARCAALVPEKFDLDDEGYAFVLAGQEQVAEDDELARIAIDNCPEEAIVLEPDE